MTVKHSLMTDAINGLHEPKGASTAAAGDVYQANGAGSGAWRSLTPVNVVRVEALADFPAPVATVITLVADTLYMIAGTVDIGANSIVMGNNSSISGNIVTLDSLTSSTSGTFITTTSSCTFVNITLSAPSAKLFSATGGGSLAEIFIVSNVTVLSCDTLGTFNNWGLIVFSEFGLLGATTGGIDFIGACGEFKTFGATYEGFGGIGIDLDTATFNGVFLGPNVRVSAGGGATCLNVAPNSANINANLRGFIFNNIFEGAGTISVGLAVDDILWQASGNAGIPDSEIGAQGNILTSALTTPFAGTGPANSVIVNFGTAFVPDILDQFTISTAGRFTYTGKETHLFYFDATLFASITGGASRQYAYCLNKNGTDIDSSCSKAEYDGSNPGSNSVSSLVELSENDFVELFVYAITATTTLTVDTASIKIRTK